MKAEQILNQLKELGTIEAVTGGMNGYPVPETGLAFIPNDLESLEKARDLIPGEPANSVFFSRDGWAMVQHKGEIRTRSGLLEPTDDDFGDNYRIITIDYENEIEEAAADEAFFGGGSTVEEAVENGAIHPDEKEDAISNFESLKENLEIGHNLLHCGEFMEVIDPLGWNFDTQRWRVGLFIDNHYEPTAEIWEAEYL